MQVMFIINMAAGSVRQSNGYHIFPAAEHHRPFASTKLHFMVTGRQTCEQHVQTVLDYESDNLSITTLYLSHSAC